MRPFINIINLLKLKFIDGANNNNNINLKTKRMKVKRKKQDLLDILPIGIELIKNDKAPEDKGYYKAINDGTVHYNKDYSKFPEGKGKVIIYFNINYSDTGIFAEIQQDAGTRKVYHGIIPDRAFFIYLLTNIR